MTKIADIYLKDGKVIIEPEPNAPIQILWPNGLEGSPVPANPARHAATEDPPALKPSIVDMFEDYDNVLDAALANDKKPSTESRNRALAMGLNKYPGAQLDGCVNDGGDIINYAFHTNIFGKADIRVSFDETNTRENMMERLKWVLADAKPGDIRLIHYSGHGAQFAGDMNGFQPDHQHDVWCPIDFDWSEEHMIMDVQLFELFKSVPAGVKVWLLSDSCHSGKMVRELGNPVRPNKSRAYPWSPSHVKGRLTKARGNVHRALIGQTLDLGFGSGCRHDQTSADTQDEHGRPCGAFTHYLLRTLATGANKPFSTVIHDVNEALAHNGYTQRPQAECARADRPFLS